MYFVQVLLLGLILQNTVGTFDTYHFKSQPIRNHEKIEEIKVKSIPECCVLCSENFICHATLFVNQNCILLTNVELVDTSDTSGFLIQNRPNAKINKIEIKTANTNEEDSGTNHQISFEICNELDCCKLEPSPTTHFNLNGLDTLTDTDLQDCQDFGLTKLPGVKVRLLDSTDPWLDGWLGESLKIYLENLGYFICPITKWLDDDQNGDQPPLQELDLECVYEK